MRTPVRILHLEDDPSDAELVRVALVKDLDCVVHHVSTREAFEAAIQDCQHDLILCDNSLPGYSGNGALQAVREKCPDIPVILLSGTLGEEQAIESLQQGAVDYILKIRMGRLVPAIKRALHEAEEKARHLRAERALHESERRFRIMADSAPVLIWLADRAGKCTYFNRTWLQFTGRTLKQELGDGWTEGVHPIDRPEFLEGFRQSFAKVQPFEMEFRLRRADAQYRWMLNSGVPRFEGDGTFAGYIGSLIDITDRRLADERIRYQAALLDKAQDAILVHDLNNQLIFWNKGAERIYGWSASEAIGERADDLLFQDTTPALEAHRAVVEHGEWAGELRQVHKSGKELFVQSRWTLVPDPTGKAILVINTDISEKKTLENKFLRAQRLESIGVLAGGIAHDLNNVLVPILVVAELLRTKVTDSDSIEWLDTLESSAKHGANLIKQILAFSRGMGGERVQVQLRHLILEIQKILRETFPRSIDVQCDIPSDLWLISAVATHLSQVLMNLCVNSRDAMPHGGRIQIKCENVVFDKTYAQLQGEAAEGPYVVVTVADTGTGIPAESMEHIFEPFFTTKEMGKGTGLGLSTVKGIIKNHGGFITVQSELGQGTAFKLHLPAITASAESTAAPPRPSLLRGNGELILVVEHETAVRSVIEATLQEYGYRVLTAADGAQALASLAENREDVKAVVTGLTLPDLDAGTMMARIGEVAHSLKFIVVSGTLDQERLTQVRRAGEVESLAKPFAAEELLKLLAKILVPV
ncbi:MAG: PAS domain S-box protein [Verrucomicrobiales bacterium]|nr:PAS domain S-box protein [Verrucomicrobiales bacterium]